MTKTAEIMANITQTITEAIKAHDNNKNSQREDGAPVSSNYKI